jgi:hypothetical protein
MVVLVLCVKCLRVQRGYCAAYYVVFLRVFIPMWVAFVSRTLFSLVPRTGCVNVADPRQHRAPFVSRLLLQQPAVSVSTSLTACCSHFACSMYTIPRNMFEIFSSGSAVVCLYGTKKGSWRLFRNSCEILAENPERKELSAGSGRKGVA